MSYMLKWLKILWYKPIEYKGKYYRRIDKGICSDCALNKINDCNINYSNKIKPCYTSPMGNFKEVK